MKSVLRVCHQFAILLLVASLLTVSAWGADFTFTAIPDQDTTRLQERFGKIADYLSEELGITVKYVPVKSYSASVQAFKNNEVQLAWFGGLFRCPSPYGSSELGCYRARGGRSRLYQLFHRQ